MEIKKNVSLKTYNSWRVGGEAEFFCLPKTIPEIIEAVTWAKNHQHSIHLLSGGTNVLISDYQLQGLTLCFRNFSELIVDPITEDSIRLKMEASAGTKKSDVLKVFLKQELAPAHFLSGIPGDVAGGIVMNAGVSEPLMPAEFGQIVDWVEVLRFEDLRIEDLRVERVEASQIRWEYRHSYGWQPGIILRIGLSWPLNPKDPQIAEKVKLSNKNRMMKQPLEWPNCGSVFVNPVGYKAAQLIEHCDLKGTTIGGAEVSKKHANFIINRGEAKAQDIWKLIQLVKTKVHQITGVLLQTEVVPMGQGFDPDP